MSHQENAYIELFAVEEVSGARERFAFSLSSSKALDSYWETLEYFFSAAEPSAARLVFPGSCVPELFGLRSWASLQLTTVEQRKLEKQINRDKKLSVQQCLKIAKDLNLPIAQVLHFEKTRGVRLQSLHRENPSPSLPKAHRSSWKFAQPEDDVFSRPIPDHHNVEKVVEKNEHPLKNIQIEKTLKPFKSRRFPWNDELDRLLLFAYSRQRALLGARITSVNWNCMPGLPGPPLVCRRRITALRMKPTLRKAILDLCLLLAARYERHCQQLEDSGEHSTEFLGEQWDRPDEPSVVAAIEEIIRCKRRAASDLEAEAEFGSGSRKRSVTTSATSSKRPRNRLKTASASLLPSVSEEQDEHHGVGVANAIEFIKLMFLNSSQEVELPKEFKETLRKLNHCDLMTAFKYLEDRGMLTSGEGSSAFVLSQKFARDLICPSFPHDEVLAASTWLQEHETEIEHGWVPYDLQHNCGELMHIFTEASLGKLLLSPGVPENGIGEPDDTTTIGCSFKRKAGNEERDARTVKARLETHEYYRAARRERGFPGVDVLVHRRMLPLPEVLPSSFSESEEPPSPSANDGRFSPAEDLLRPEILQLALRQIEKSGGEGLSMAELAEALSFPKAELYSKELERNDHVKTVNAFDHVRLLARAQAAPYFIEFSEEGENGSRKLPIYPWLTSDGSSDSETFKGLARLVMRMVMSNPGITQKGIIGKLEVLSPQTSKDLLGVLELDGVLFPRRVMYSKASPPSFLGGLVKQDSQGSEPYVQQIHYYLNPSCAALL